MLNLPAQLFRSIPLTFLTHPWRIAGIVALTVFSANGETLVIDGSHEGRIYDGHGAMSAGASTRLLIDYPEPWVRTGLFPAFTLDARRLRLEMSLEAVQPIVEIVNHHEQDVGCEVR